MTLLKKWKITRLERRLQRAQKHGAYHRSEQRRLALEAYDITDMCAEPLRWGHLQNAANWEGYHAKRAMQEADAIARKLRELT